MVEATTYLDGIITKDESSRSKVIELQAWIEGKQGRYARQIELLKDALAHASPWNRGAILHALSALVAEMYSPQLGNFVRDEAERMRWTQDMQPFRFQVMRNLGYCAALDGNETQALKFFRESGKIAPSLASEILVLLDRAFLSHGMDCTIHARDILDAAAELADTVAWENVKDDERFALLNLAKGMSHFEPTRAKAYWDRYRSLSQMAATCTLRNDVRRTAYELEAEGAVAKGLGNRTEAANLFKSAFQIYTRIDYKWRAAIVVSRMLDLSYAGGLRSDYADFLRVVTTTQFPRAWFTKTLGRHLQFQTDPRVLSLIPSQTQILDYLLKGTAHKEIGDHLSISHKTVTNRATEIYRVFEVNSQSELIALFVKNGLLR